MAREAGLPNQYRMDRLMQKVDAAAEIGARGLCKDRSDLFTDYESPLEDHSEAKGICASCDIFEMCQQWAREVKPAWGIWGGKVWLNGKTKNHRKVYSEEEDSDRERGRLQRTG